MEKWWDVAVLAVLYAAFFYRRWRRQGTYALLFKSLLYAYLVGVAYVTLMPVLTALPHVLDHSYVPMHLIPFSDVLQGYGGARSQIVLNVLMTVPLGFLVPSIRPCGAGKAVAATFTVSLFIELMQPLLSVSRYSDVTDLITNTAGGLIGYGLYLLLKEPLRALIEALEENRRG